MVALADSYPGSDWEPAPEPTVIKTLSLRQFLSAHIRLKGQATAASSRKGQEQLLARPLPPKYDVYEVTADGSGNGDGLIVTFQDGSIQDQLTAAAARCEELAEQVRLLRTADLDV